MRIAAKPPFRYERMMNARILSLILGAGAVCLALQNVSAVTFNIANGDVAGLINAINIANNNDDFDTINLATNGLYTLTTVNNSTNGTNGLPLVQNDVSFGGTELGTDLTINGNGATLERNEFAPLFRLWQVVDGATCQINNLHVNRGRVIDLTGNQGGGAVYNNISRVILAGCTFDNNSTVGVAGVLGNPGTPGGAGRGGAIYSSGVVMQAASCTFTNNKADGGAGGQGLGGIALGGAIFSANNVLYADNCSFIGNFGSGGADGTSQSDFYGGAIATAGGLITGCTFTSNTGKFGGALAVTLGGTSATIANSTFQFNIADSGGGAIHNRGETIINNCGVNNGRATLRGGGIYNEAALTITNSTISANVTTKVEPFGGGDRGGGGIFHEAVAAGASLTVRNTIVQNNLSGIDNNPPASDGGGLYLLTPDPITSIVLLERCTLRGNSAAGGGGICYISHGSATLTVKDSTLSANLSRQGGGMVAWGEDGIAALELTNCTLSENTGSVFGGSDGGIYLLGTNNGSTDVTLTSCTFSRNYGALGSVISNGGTASYTLRSNIFKSRDANPNIAPGDATIISQGNNLSNDAAGGNGTTGPGGFLNATGDIRNTDPLLDVLAANGGATQTHALFPASPAINTGSPTAPFRDQRHRQRTNAPDIGAFEFNGGPAVPELVSVLSRRAHGASGNFDLDLPVVGPPGVECRVSAAGGSYQLLLTFGNSVTVGGISVTSIDGQATGNQSVFGSVVTVNLGSVANAQTLGITLANVNDGTDVGDILIPLRILLGDTNGSGSVSASDVAQVKSQSGQTVGPTNFRLDVTASGGSLNASDVGLVKAMAGTQLPAAAEKLERVR